MSEENEKSLELVSLRPQELIIPDTDPFLNDALAREMSVEALSNLIDQIHGPLVIGLNSSWGTGKTTFVKMWRTVLESRGYACIYLDSWSSDFSVDPLLPFLSELENLGDEVLGGNEGFQSKLEVTKKIASVVLRRGLPATVKAATLGVLDIDQVYEEVFGSAASDIMETAVDAYAVEKTLSEKLRQSLKESIDCLEAANKKPNLIVFIDELDRCRPTFAIDLLERIKHIFSAENTIFIISIDKEQLAVSLKAVYGEGLDTQEYLRRFIDTEYFLPQPDSNKFIRSMIERFDYSRAFAGRRNARDELETIIRMMADLIQVINLNLRAMEQSIAHIRSVLLMTGDQQTLLMPLLVILVILKLRAPNVYRAYALESKGATPVIEYFRSLDGGPEFLNSHAGIMSEAWLIAAGCEMSDENPEVSFYRNRIADESIEEQERERAARMVQRIEGISSHANVYSILGYLVPKIELTARSSQ